jgi:hypothetical protein
MLREIPRSNLYSRVWRFVLFFVAASASFQGFYTQCHFHEVGISGGWEPTSFQRMVDGTADRPYIYRQMLPEIANWIDSATSQDVKDKWYRRQWSSSIGYINAITVSPAAKNKVYFFRYVIFYGTTFLFTLLAVYSMYLVCNALEMPAISAVFAPIIVILILPYFMNSYQGSGHFYDYPELALMSLAIWITLKFDWWWAIPLVALGTWNKESFLLVVLTLYPFIRRRHSRVASLIGVAVLCGACLAVYYPIRLRFAHNPGSTLEMHWLDQLAFFTDRRALILGTQETYGVRLINTFSVLPIALLVWTVWRAWKKLPLAVKRHAQIAAAINIPLYFLFCAPGELRDLSMLYVALLLVVAVNLNECIPGTEQTLPLQGA